MTTKHRLHVLSVPHAVTVPEYSSCAFTAKVLKFCKMMRARGHYILHYGNELSAVDCDEHITVTTTADLEKSYPGHDWRTQSFPDFKMEDRVYQTFYGLATGEIHRRKQPGDFLVATFGVAHKQVADAHPDMIVVEGGVGYPATFAKYKVYESYAAMHSLYGPERLRAPFNDGWYDCVIPNYFDLADFTYREEKDDYFLYLGRVGEGKGTHIAADVVGAIGGKLVVAGHGPVPQGSHVYPVGVVGPEKRRNLLSHAKAVFCPTMYVEPFCGVQIEAMLSGTPVISTDYGAFAEYNLHGVTGYRCHTREQFIWAARNIDRIKPSDCREWAARNFSLEAVGPRYEEYFASLATLHNGGGWNSENPDRTELDWLNWSFPKAPVEETSRVLFDANLTEIAA